MIPVRGSLIGILSVVCALSLNLTTASAKELPGVLHEFGSLEKPTGIAINEATGEVFVGDSEGAQAVYVFGPEGEGPLAELKGSPEAAFSFGGIPVGVAVDNDPSSASYQDVYVTDVFNNHVDKFKRVGPHEYVYECEIDGWNGSATSACTSGASSPEQPFVFPLGVTVDSSGNVYISSYGPENGSVDEFDETGKGVMQLASAGRASLEGHPQDLAVDSTGDLFVRNFSSPQVVKFTFSSPGTVASEVEIGSGTTALAIDPTTDELYLDRGGEAAVLNPSGERLRLIQLDPTGESHGVAVSGSTHEIYVASSGSHNVRILGLVKVPDVSSCNATHTTSSGATLQGEVDPLETSGAAYHFEYGQSLSYELATEAAEIVGDGFMPVATPVVGLEAGTLYHCRLDATDAIGVAAGVLNQGADGTFETMPNRPTVLGTTASSISTDNAVFRGSVNPGRGTTSYHFEYGKTISYGNVLPNVGIGGKHEGTEISVEQASGPILEPGTEYHLALVAENLSGATVGEDIVFKTLPALLAPEAPVVTGIAANLTSPTSVKLEGLLDSKLQRTSVRFKLGSSPAYGTEVFVGVGPGAGPETVAVGFQGLAPGVAYHFKIVAAGPGGTFEGPDMTFTTPGLPVALVPQATPLLIPTPVFPAIKNPPLPKHKPKKKHKKSRHKRTAKKRH
jgi:hypothetical protein